MFLNVATRSTVDEWLGSFGLAREMPASGRQPLHTLQHGPRLIFLNGLSSEGQALPIIEVPLADDGYVTSSSRGKGPLDHANLPATTTRKRVHRSTCGRRSQQASATPATRFHRPRISPYFTTTNGPTNASKCGNQIGIASLTATSVPFLPNGGSTIICPRPPAPETRQTRSPRPPARNTCRSARNATAPAPCRVAKCPIVSAICFGSHGMPG